jgi:hypothetical protein
LAITLIRPQDSRPPTENSEEPNNVIAQATLLKYKGRMSHRKIHNAMMRLFDHGFAPEKRARVYLILDLNVGGIRDPRS